MNNIKVIYDHAGLIPQGITINKIYTIDELLKILPMEKIKILFKTTDGKRLDDIESESTGIETKEEITNIEIKPETVKKIVEEVEKKKITNKETRLTE